MAVAKSQNKWSERDIRTSVEAYLLMLRIQQSGLKPNKSAIRDAYLPQLQGPRSTGSWERRMCNISAVFSDLGLPTVSGYGALRNVGKNVRNQVVKATLRCLI
jgi:5-methylcytosine-specific restriction protein A